MYFLIAKSLDHGDYADPLGKFHDLDETNTCGAVYAPKTVKCRRLWTRKAIVSIHTSLLIVGLEQLAFRIVHGHGPNIDEI